MNNQTIVCCVVALLLGMLLANMLKSVCGCKLTEGQDGPPHGKGTNHPEAAMTPAERQQAQAEAAAEADSDAAVLAAFESEFEDAEVTPPTSSDEHALRIRQQGRCVHSDDNLRGYKAANAAHICTLTTANCSGGGDCSATCQTNSGCKWVSAGIQQIEEFYQQNSVLIEDNPQMAEIYHLMKEHFMESL